VPFYVAISLVVAESRAFVKFAVPFNCNWSPLMNASVIVRLVAVLSAAFWCSAASADFIYQSTFDANDGGIIVDSGDAQGPWQYNAGLGTWSVNGSTDIGAPSYSAIRTPAAVVGNAGPVDVYITHRYSFEYDGILWDGGQVRLSVNGGPYNAVDNGSFTTGGYVGAIQGNNALIGQLAYNGDSPGYGAGEFIVSHASLGSHPAGTTISVEFFGAWDEFTQGQLPNWEVTDVRVTDTPIPEPSTMALAIAAAATGFAAWRRRVKRA
jgi:hypothetical protein